MAKQSIPIDRGKLVTASVGGPREPVQRIGHASWSSSCLYSDQVGTAIGDGQGAQADHWRQDVKVASELDMTVFRVAAKPPPGARRPQPSSAYPGSELGERAKAAGDADVGPPAEDTDLEVGDVSAAVADAGPLSLDRHVYSEASPADVGFSALNVVLANFEQPSTPRGKEESPEDANAGEADAAGEQFEDADTASAAEQVEDAGAGCAEEPDAAESPVPAASSTEENEAEAQRDGDELSAPVIIEAPEAPAEGPPSRAWWPSWLRWGNGEEAAASPEAGGEPSPSSLSSPGTGLPVKGVRLAAITEETSLELGSHSPPPGGAAAKPARSVTADTEDVLDVVSLSFATAHGDYAAEVLASVTAAQHGTQAAPEPPKRHYFDWRPSRLRWMSSGARCTDDGDVCAGSKTSSPRPESSMNSDPPAAMREGGGDEPQSPSASTAAMGATPTLAVDVEVPEDPEGEPVVPVQRQGRHWWLTHLGRNVFARASATGVGTAGCDLHAAAAAESSPSAAGLEDVETMPPAPSQDLAATNEGHDGDLSLQQGPRWHVRWLSHLRRQVLARADGEGAHACESGLGGEAVAGGMEEGPATPTLPAEAPQDEVEASESHEVDAALPRQRKELRAQAFWPSLWRQRKDAEARAESDPVAAPAPEDCQAVPEAVVAPLSQMETHVASSAEDSTGMQAGDPLGERQGQGDDTRPEGHDGRHKKKKKEKKSKKDRHAHDADDGADGGSSGPQFEALSRRVAELEKLLHLSALNELGPTPVAVQSGSAPEGLPDAIAADAPEIPGPGAGEAAQGSCDTAQPREPAAIWENPFCAAVGELEEAPLSQPPARKPAGPEPGSHGAAQPESGPVQHGPSRAAGGAMPPRRTAAFWENPLCAAVGELEEAPLASPPPSLSRQGSTERQPASGRSDVQSMGSHGVVPPRRPPAFWENPLCAAVGDLEEAPLAQV